MDERGVCGRARANLMAGNYARRRRCAAVACGVPVQRRLLRRRCQHAELTGQQFHQNRNRSGDCAACTSHASTSIDSARNGEAYPARLFDPTKDDKRMAGDPGRRAARS
jgi:hypothetical protein